MTGKEAGHIDHASPQATPPHANAPNPETLEVAAGTLKYRESVADGLATAPEAFLGLLKGRNFGKQIVKLV